MLKPRADSSYSYTLTSFTCFLMCFLEWEKEMKLQPFGQEFTNPQPISSGLEPMVSQYIINSCDYCELFQSSIFLESSFEIQQSLDNIFQVNFKNVNILCQKEEKQKLKLECVLVRRGMRKKQPELLSPAFFKKHRAIDIRVCSFELERSSVLSHKLYQRVWK